jgi:hypothetical protein
MPAHNIIFSEHVPSEFELQPPVFPNGATRVCLHAGWGAQLRRMDAAEDRFVPGAPYHESWIILPNWKASGNTGLYGFQVDSILTGSDKSDIFGGSLSFQLSNDNGATWLYHNGTSWSTVVVPVWAVSAAHTLNTLVQPTVANGFYYKATTAGVSGLTQPVWPLVLGATVVDGGVTWTCVSTYTVWNTKEQIDFKINVFPLTADKQVKVKVLMTPSAGGKATPFLRRVTVYGGLEYDFQIDLLRSMKDWLERHVWVSTMYFVQIPQPTEGGSVSCGSATGSDVIMITDKKWEEFSGPAEVYNLTTDPGRTTNLFASFIAGGIQMTSIQTGYIEARFYARPAVYIGAEEFMEFARIPSIVVQLTSAKERRDLRRGSREVDYAVERRVARINMSRVWFDAEFRISCQSDLMAEATRMSDAVNRAITEHQFVLSLATGETMPVPYSTPLTPAHRIAQGLFVREYACTLFGKAWLRSDTTIEEQLAEKIVFLINPGMAAQTYDSLEIAEVP